MERKSKEVKLNCIIIIIRLWNSEPQVQRLRNRRRDDSFVRCVVIRDSQVLWKVVVRVGRSCSFFPGVDKSTSSGSGKHREDMVCKSISYCVVRNFNLCLALSYKEAGSFCRYKARNIVFSILPGIVAIVVAGLVAPNWEGIRTRRSFYQLHDSSSSYPLAILTGDLQQKGLHIAVVDATVRNDSQSTSIAQSFISLVSARYPGLDLRSYVSAECAESLGLPPFIDFLKEYRSEEEVDNVARSRDSKIFAAIVFLRAPDTGFEQPAEHGSKPLGSSSSLAWEYKVRMRDGDAPSTLSLLNQRRSFAVTVDQHQYFESALGPGFIPLQLLVERTILNTRDEAADLEAVYNWVFEVQSMRMSAHSALGVYSGPQGCKYPTNFHNHRQVRCTGKVLGILESYTSHSCRSFDHGRNVFTTSKTCPLPVLSLQLTAFHNRKSLLHHTRLPSFMSFNDAFLHLI